MLDGKRLFLPYNGWIDIGFDPISDGDGIPNVQLSVVITYKDGWLALNENQLASFIIALREAGGYENLYGRRYFERSSSADFERFEITKIENYFNIIFVDGDGDTTFINRFMEYDVLGMLKMESIIDSRIETQKLRQSDVVNIIESTAIKCIDNPSKILELAEYKHCDSIILEIAVNHFHFFYSFVEEKKGNDEPHTE